MSLEYATPETELRSILEADEVVVWSGRPRPTFSLSGGDVFPLLLRLLFPIAFIAFFILVSTGSLGRVRAPASMFWFFFVPIGVLAPVIRYFSNFYLRRSTVYAVTDRRVIARTGTRNIKTRFISFAALHDVVVRERSDGSGSIDFGSSHSQNYSKPVSFQIESTRKNSPTPLLVFEQIEAVNRVAQIISEQQTRFRKLSPPQ